MRASSPIEPARRHALRIAALGLGAWLLAGCSTPPALPAPDAAVRAALAPRGLLRIAVYPGSPTSMLTGEPGSDPRGVAVEVGQALARRLGVPAELKVFPRVAEVIAALQRGDADVTITNATPERAALLDFTPPLLALEDRKSVV